jgi:hypothetical protein
MREIKRLQCRNLLNFFSFLAFRCFDNFHWILPLRRSKAISSLNTFSHRRTSTSFTRSQLSTFVLCGFCIHNFRNDNFIDLIDRLLDVVRRKFSTFVCVFFADYFIAHISILRVCGYHHLAAILGIKCQCYSNGEGSAGKLWRAES